MKITSLNSVIPFLNRIVARVLGLVDGCKETIMKMMRAVVVGMVLKMLSGLRLTLKWALGGYMIVADDFVNMAVVALMLLRGLVMMWILVRL